MFVVRQSHSWYENVGERQVRSPKVYIGDSGILHALLALTTRSHSGSGAAGFDRDLCAIAGYAKPAARSGGAVSCPMVKSFFPQTSRPRASQIGRSAKLEG